MRRCECGKMSYQYHNGDGYCLECYHDVDWDFKSSINTEGRHYFKQRMNDGKAKTAVSEG